MTQYDFGGLEIDTLLSKENSRAAELYFRYQKLHLLTWLEPTKPYEQTILPVWGNSKFPFVPNENGQPISNFHSTSGPKDYNHLIATTTGEELDHDYAQLYETMHDAVTAMVQVSPLLSSQS